MGSLYYTSRKRRGVQCYIVRVRVKSPVVKALVPQFTRDLKALVRKWHQLIVKKARMKAKKK